ncbi:hypothetical protein BGP_0434 [Beggiatoa sp. PS]|nr:hypothetical protein BGP_0434 [Beggiatoa sp. PS]
MNGAKMRSIFDPTKNLIFSTPPLPLTIKKANKITSRFQNFGTEKANKITLVSCAIILKSGNYTEGISNQ